MRPHILKHALANAALADSFSKIAKLPTRTYPDGTAYKGFRFTVGAGKTLVVEGRVGDQLKEGDTISIPALVRDDEEKDSLHREIGATFVVAGRTREVSARDIQYIRY